MNIPEDVMDMLTSQFGGGVVWFFVSFWVGITVVGYIIGFVREQQHLLSLRKREREFEKVRLFNSKVLPTSAKGGELVAANVALASDSFRILSVLFRRLFGGRVRRYERINTRAKREALIRLKEAALGQEADAVFNVRLESSEIVSGPRGGGGTSVEVLAYGTAVSLGDGV